MDKILEVKKLKISFRTTGGTVKAVRDISFDLERGKTVAIVGESGSGKSVTSKAILGILAGNSIIEGGEILYDGKDLLAISEDDMYKIRGDKISMIFQDPLSSLNPIVKIGRQITEAMLLKNKANRKEARSAFNGLLAILKGKMTAAEPEKAAKIAEMCKTFDDFCIQGTKLEQSYNMAEEEARELASEIGDFLFRTGKNQKADVKEELKRFIARLRKVKDEFLTDGRDEEIAALISGLTALRAGYRAPKKSAGSFVLPDEIREKLEATAELMNTITSGTRPDFFRIGYYRMKNPGESLSGKNIAELNESTLDYLNKNFMDEFFESELKGVKHAYYETLPQKREVISLMDEAAAYYSGEYTKKEALEYAKKLAAAVEGSINRVEIIKDSMAYTFRTGITGAIEKYFAATVNNPKEEKRFARQTARREALIARGRTVDWKVVPKNVYDLDELKAQILTVVTRMKAHYEEYCANESSKDFAADAENIIDFFKAKASDVVYVVTPGMAKEKAIKLMDEVGISEPRMRYNQYPFEFSGGMRQRIVIAIALAANPDILICDEPTTALDVTIQAQILELINDLKRERNLSVIFITHDLGVVANMADDIAVMYAGKIVEYGTADDIFYDPRHPYTWALLSSMPDLDTSEKLDAIPGTPPNMIYPPVGDAFADRNKYAMQIDFEQQPPMFEISETHKAATWLLHPDAPKVEMPAIISERIARMKKTGGAN